MDYVDIAVLAYTLTSRMAHRDDLCFSCEDDSLGFGIPSRKQNAST